MSVSDRTIRCLEWDKVKNYLSQEAHTPCGKERCLSIALFEDVEIIEGYLQETDEALSLIESRSNLTQDGLSDLRKILDRLSIGAELAAAELFDIANMLKIARLNKSVLSKLDVENFPKLKGFTAKLDVLEPLVVAIDSVVDEHGEVKKDASVDLLRLTKEAKRIEGQIKEELNKIIHSLSKSLQEPIITQRNDRYVLPVIASFRHTVSGIVHGSSSSGLTVYVEPAAVLELTNNYRLKQGEIEREIARILSELSSKCSQHSLEMGLTYWTLIELDVIMAKARLAKKYQGVKPVISREGQLSFYAAKHPLLILQGMAPYVVANDIVLNESTKTLVITGPNTGGKTVYLKTAGLLSLMIRAGLMIPVGAKSSAVVFSSIYADIGDEQSLEQSLSTFSSHMTSIVEIVSKAGAGCLVLLDEVGAGTDPKEGAALARAILEHLNESSAYTISSTHFGELKTLAYTVPGFLNASLEFDEETLSPTYKLKAGIPGSSKATTIAGRLGLKQDIVDYANTLLSDDQVNAQQIIDKLEAKLKQADIRENQAHELWKQAQELELEAKSQMNQVSEREERIRKEFAFKMEEEFKLAKETLRELIAQLQKEPSSKRAEQTQKEMDALREQLNWLSPPGAIKNTPILSIGQSVKVVSLNQTASVVELLPPTGKQNELRVTVRAGNMRITVPATDVVLAVNPKVKASSRATAYIADQQSRRGGAPVFIRTGSNTIDLRGQRVDEALVSLEKFLDNAVVNSISPIMVIHGHGTGAVKGAVREYLSDSKYLQAFRPGEPQEGGDGVTVVQL